MICRRPSLNLPQPSWETSVVLMFLIELLVFMKPRTWCDSSTWFELIRVYYLRI